MQEPMTSSNLRGSEMAGEMTANEASDKASLPLSLSLYLSFFFFFFSLSLSLSLSVRVGRPCSKDLGSASIS